jgi:hypothetical protein
MKPIYEVIEDEGHSPSIKATYENGVVLSIPMDTANSDYQAYLESLNDNSEAE